MLEIINHVISRQEVLSVLNLVSRNILDTSQLKPTSFIQLTPRNDALSDLTHDVVIFDICLDEVDSPEQFSKIKYKLSLFEYACVIIIHSERNFNNSRNNYIQLSNNKLKLISYLSENSQIEFLATQSLSNPFSSVMILRKSFSYVPSPLNLVKHLYARELARMHQFKTAHNLGHYSDELLREVTSIAPFLNQKRHAIDVGARHGVFTYHLLSNGFKKVSAFEVNPDFRESFFANVDSERTDFYNIGLYDRNTTIHFEGRIGKGIKEIGGQGRTVYSIDSFCFTEVDLIKIDVDGCDRQILRGCKETIKKCLPVVFIETENVQLKYDPEGLDNLAQIYSWLLTDFNYKIAFSGRNTLLVPND